MHRLGPGSLKLCMSVVGEPPITEAMQVENSWPGRIKCQLACQVHWLFLPLVMACINEDVNTLYGVVCLCGFDFTFTDT